MLGKVSSVENLQISFHVQYMHDLVTRQNQKET